MISLYVKDYCSNCPEFEPSVNKSVIGVGDLMGLDERPTVLTEIFCEHRRRCEELKDFIEKENKYGNS